MRDVVWSPRARRVYAKIIEYLSARDEQAARLVESRLLDAGFDLGTILTGRPARVKGYFEKSVAKTSHILLYQVRTHANREYVLIADIVHMSRNWPKARMPPR